MPAPPVNYNLTYVCPEGQVFSHDWFATPFILMTCQVLCYTCQDIRSIFSRESDSTIANVRPSVTETPQHLRITPINH